MKTAVYGEIDDEIFEQQQKLLEGLRPRTTGPEDYPLFEKGQRYAEDGTFLSSGDQGNLAVTPGTKRHDQHRQGYKLHVSAHPEQAAAVAAAVLPVVRSEELAGVVHKVADLGPYAKDPDVVQRGKFITVYAKDEEQLKLIAKRIQSALKQEGITAGKHGGGLSPGDAEVGQDGLMSVRWGQFGGSPKDKVKVDGKWTDDIRKKPCPDEMRERFDEVVRQTNEVLGLENKHEAKVDHTPSLTKSPRVSTRDSIKLEKDDLPLGEHEEITVEAPKLTKAPGKETVEEVLSHETPFVPRKNADKRKAIKFK